MDILKIIKDCNGFDSFNPVQEKAIKKNVLEKSMVISSPTSSGKTLIAEIAALNSVLNNQKKVVYTCPLRALASEHSSDFRKKYGEKFSIKSVLSTGDFDSSGKYLSSKDVIFTTYEKLNSLLNNNSEWLNEIGLLVVDEIHSLGSDRGATLEMVITKLRFLNKDLQIIGLSATIPNAKQISKWLDAELIESDYRPVKLKEGVYLDEKINFKKDSEEIKAHTDVLSSIALNTLNKKKQALFFANTRRSSEATAKKLALITEKVLSEDEKLVLKKASEKILSVLEQPTTQCKTLANLIQRGACFHNAGLLQKQRVIIEDLFKARYLKFISSTPTLSQGVNLPAFRVVIQSPYRYSGFGMQRIPIAEYKQMCLPYSTEVVTKEKGVMAIGKIVEKELTFNVLSFDLKKQIVEFKPITNFFERQSKDLVKLNFEDGNSLTITKNHEVLIFRNNVYVWVPAGKIISQDVVLSLKKQEVIENKLPFFYEQFPIKDTYVLNCGKLFKKSKLLGFTEKELAKKVDINVKRIYHIKNDKKAMPLSVGLKLCDLLGYSKKKKASLFRLIKSKYGQCMKIPIYPSKNFLWLIGFIASDGNINKVIDKRTDSEYVTIRVFNTNEKLIKKAEHCFLEFNLNFYKNKRDDGLITLESGATLLSKVLVNHYGLEYNNKTSTVSTPSFLENLSSEYIGAYLGGIFDGDGNFNCCKQKEWKGTNVYRILFVTGSKKFALGIQKLLRKMGIISTFSVDKKIRKSILKGKEITFSKPNYYVIFRKIEYIKTFSKFAKIYKTKINVEYSKYHNVNKRDNSNSDYLKLKVKKIKKLKSKMKVYNIAVQNNENYFANNCLVHNCGRAGRPKYDSEGQAILIAKTELEKDDYFDYFVNGEIEDVASKLASESLLRFHLLSAIASGFIFDLDSAEQFFSKTFYAEQSRDLSYLFTKVTSIVRGLEEMGFVDADENRIDATNLGKRVVQLYLDPDSAFRIITSLRKNNFADLSYLFLITNTVEFFPLLNVPKNKELELWELIQEEKALLPVNIDVEMYSDNFLLQKYWTSFLLKEWISEVKEQALVDEFKIQPGILRAKLSNADWLAYSALELSKVLGFEEHFVYLNKIRKRLKSGIKEELVALCELRGVGRVRARRMFNAGIKSIKDVKKIDVKDLERVLSPKIALKVKAQLTLKK